MCNEFICILRDTCVHYPFNHCQGCVLHVCGDCVLKKGCTTDSLKHTFSNSVHTLAIRKK